jgi:tetratricopeptide (TPR) repeat protein
MPHLNRHDGRFMMRLRALCRRKGHEMAARLARLALIVLLAPAGVYAQNPPLKLPEASPAATVSQRIGLSDITVRYHRPAVKQRTVWGDLVPYDQVWRAGANENTVLSVSTPVTIGGKLIPAGDYGLHVIPTKTDWTVILNTESTAWGSFFYDQAKDAVRFTTRPQPADFQEYLAYTFDAPSEDGVTLTLRWEKVGLAIPIAVDTPTVVSDSLEQQLHGLPGFFWQGFAQAAAWSARHNANLDRAQAWADRAVAMNRNYQTLRASALVRERKGDAAGAEALRKDAMGVATEADINAAGYELLGTNKVDEAIALFRKNATEHANSWNVYDSLGEALALKGQTAEAATQYRKALSMVGDETNKKRIEGILAKLAATQ